VREKATYLKTLPSETIAAAFSSPFLPNRIYVEADCERSVINACRHFMIGQPAFIPPGEYHDLFSSASGEIKFKQHTFVRINQRNRHRGDLAFVTDVSQTGINALVVPRQLFGRKRDHRGRLPAALFSVNAVRAIAGQVSGATSQSYTFKEALYVNGLRKLELPTKYVRALTAANHPKMGELSLFYSSGYAREHVMKYISAAMKRRWRAGQRLLISDGQLKGISCTLMSIDFEKELVLAVGVNPEEELELSLSSVEQCFLVGDSVIVLVGDCVGRHGIIVKVQESIQEIVVVEDGTREEVRFR
jgi:hypothetical protein